MTNNVERCKMFVESQETKELYMTNTEMLERKISDSGLSVTELSIAVGISENALARKIRGEDEFFVSELWTVGEVLELDAAEMQEIFLQAL